MTRVSILTVLTALVAATLTHAAFASDPVPAPKTVESPPMTWAEVVGDGAECSPEAETQPVDYLAAGSLSCSCSKVTCRAVDGSIDEKPGCSVTCEKATARCDCNAWCSSAGSAYGTNSCRC